MNDVSATNSNRSKRATQIEQTCKETGTQLTVRPNVKDGLVISLKGAGVDVTHSIPQEFDSVYVAPDGGRIDFRDRKGSRGEINALCGPAWTDAQGQQHPPSARIFHENIVGRERLLHIADINLKTGRFMTESWQTNSTEDPPRFVHGSHQIRRDDDGQVLEDSRTRIMKRNAERSVDWKPWG